MLIPPAVMSVLDRVKAIKTNPRVRFFAELSVIGATVSVYERDKKSEEVGGKKKKKIKKEGRKEKKEIKKKQ